MTTYSQIRKDCHRWATFDYDANVDNELVKSYTAHFREVDALTAKTKVVIKNCNRTINLNAT